jgi:hypothetical protein
MRARWVVALALAGCGAEPVRTPAPQRPPCEQRVAAVRELLAKVPATAPGGPSIAAVDGAGLGPPEPPFVPAQAPGGAPIEEGVAVALRSDGRLFVEDKDVGGNVVAVFDAIAGAEAAARGAGRELTVLLAFEAGAPLTKVDELVPYLKAFPRRALLVAPPGPLPPSEATLPEWARKKLAEVRRMSESPGAPVFERLVSCPSLLELEREYQSAPPGEREARLLAEVPRRLESECRCRDADVEGVAALTWIRLAPWRVELRALPFNGSIEPEDEPIALPPDATVADLVPRLVERGDKPFRLDLSGPK